MRRSGTPPDERHNHGHGRVENLAGVFEGVVLLGVGGWILWDSVRGILRGSELELMGIGMAVMALSTVVNLSSPGGS